jgi:hypothetical protein
MNRKHELELLCVYAKDQNVNSCSNQLTMNRNFLPKQLATFFLKKILYYILFRS